MTTTQIERVIETCRTARDRLIIYMLFETGLRPGELLALWLEDVSISPPQLRVVDRGELVNYAEIKRPASVRTIDVSRELINRILDYVGVAHSEVVETNHLLVKHVENMLVHRWITETCMRCSRDCNDGRQCPSLHTRFGTRR